jgi:hypothetical protein
MKNKGIIMVWSRKLSKDDIKDLVAQITTLNIMIDRMAQSQRDQAKEIKYLQTYMDARLKDELNTVERKYIAFLEGKLIQTDEEAGKLKHEREAERYRMHQHFYSKTST